MTLAELLSDLSTWTWHFLRDAPFRPREETVTESLLTEFVRTGVNSVWVHKATIGEEVEFGVDWAWALRTEAGWLVALVQAKNLAGIVIGHYPELRKKTARGQAERLVHAAALAEAVPLYVFFNDEAPPFGASGTTIAFGGCLRDELRRHTRDDPTGGLPWEATTSPAGVSLMHAEDVLENIVPPPASNQHARRVNQFAMPWECIVCPAWKGAHAPPGPPSDPSDSGEPEHPVRIADVATRLGTSIAVSSESENTRLGDAPPWLHSEEPLWATLVREMRDPMEDTDAPLSRFYIVADVTSGE